MEFHLKVSIFRISHFDSSWFLDKFFYLICLQILFICNVACLASAKLIKFIFCKGIQLNNFAIVFKTLWFPNVTCLPRYSIWKFLADSCVTRPPKSSWYTWGWIIFVKSILRKLITKKWINMRVKFYLERRRGEITTVVDWLLFSPFDICICHDKYQNYKYKKISREICYCDRCQNPGRESWSSPSRKWNWE